MHLSTIDKPFKYMDTLTSEDRMLLIPCNDWKTYAGTRAEAKYAGFPFTISIMFTKFCWSAAARVTLTILGATTHISNGALVKGKLRTTAKNDQFMPMRCHTSSPIKGDKGSR